MFWHAATLSVYVLLNKYLKHSILRVKVVHKAPDSATGVALLKVYAFSGGVAFQSRSTPI